MRAGSRVVGVLVVFFLGLNILLAQTGSTSLRGTVSDSSGAAVS
jgi:hypothetical protein